MSNLLEKASIVTTPTAYDNGKILSVKPSIVLGEELVTNGDFSNGTNDWSVANGTISVDNDRLKIDGNSGATAEQTVTAIIGKTYKVTYAFTLGTATSGALIITGGNYPTLNAPQGVNTFYTTATQTNLRIRPRLGSNGTMFIDNISVKEAIDADFDFTRNSSATRVNSQGLIEDVQILSGNLVSNGDFSQEGSELITNGDFATDSDWTKDAGWTISNGTASCNGSGVNSLQQSGITTVGKIYKLTFDVLDSNNFNFLVISANFGDTYVDADLNNAVVLGKNTFYIKPTNGTGIRFRVSNGTTLSIDNVSVKEVGQDWEFNSTAILTANGMNITTGGYIRQDVVTIGKSYKLTYDIFSYTSGDIRLYDGTNQGSLPTSIGSNTFNFIAGGSNLVIQSNSVNVNLVITNISVIEITDDTNLPRINYEGFSYQDSLGSELITNGGFDSGLNGWFSVNTTIVDGRAYVDASLDNNGYLKWNTALISGKFYKITFDLEIVQGSVNFENWFGSINKQYTGSQTITDTLIFKMDGSQNKFLFGRNGAYSPRAIFYIDNVSVKEYLGQEVVPDSGVGHILLEPQSTNLIIQSELFSDSSWTKQNSATITSNLIASPDGTINADLLNCPTTSRIVASTINVPNGIDYTFSIFIKKGTSSLFSIDLYSNGSNTLIYNFDTNVVSGGITDNSIENYGNGWYRLSGTITTASTTLFYFIYGNGGYSESEGSTYIWGAQSEQQSFATSYIPTSGSTVTRLGETLKNSGSSDLINSTEGVLYAEIAALADTADTSKYITISDGTYNNRASILFSNGSTNQIRTFLRVGGTPQIDVSNSITDVTIFNKIAFSYKQNDFKVYINGSLASSDTSGSVWSADTITKLSFSEINTSGGAFSGKVKCVAVFKEALTDEELTCLTTI